MEPNHDELAGVVDLFGGLTRGELVGSFRDLAARRGGRFEADELEAVIEAALEAYYLVAVPHEGVDLLAAGPAALPTLPDGGEDLPHLVGVDRRDLDPARLGRAAEERLRGEAARAVSNDDRERMEELLDVCYEVDAWAPVETAGIRERLAEALD